MFRGYRGDWLDADGVFAYVAELANTDLPVAKFNLNTLYEWALNHECAGLAGPFGLLRPHHIRGLHEKRSLVGSGFICSPAMCRREIARGVDWIFSNHAVRLQTSLDRACATGR